MNTVDIVAAERAAGKKPSSLWRLKDGHLELRFTNCDAITLPGTAVGAESVNAHLEVDYRTALGMLAQIAVECGWEESVKDAKKYLRDFEIVTGRATQIYPL